MMIYNYLRPRLANSFRARPRLYDFGRQARLRCFGPISKIGKLLDCYSKRQCEHFSCLQLGANDGLRNDPLRDFIVRDRWSCVFVEPLPDVFTLLENNYAYLTGGRVDLQFLNAAVSSSSGALPFYTFRESFLSGKTLEDRLHFLRKASFDLHHVLQFAKCVENIYTINVPTFGVNELLGRYFPDRAITLLALDVEGHELNILKEVDFSRFHIGAVLFETWNLGNCRDAVYSLLESNGYCIDDAEGDALATRI